MREIITSRCEKEFINKALSEDTRLDGRQLLEARPVKLYFGSNWGCCIASLGRTKVIANVSCDIQQPKLSRPNEGMVYINVELNPLAAVHFESGRQSEAGVLITRQLEKCFKDSKCVDLESLCIVADKKVWNIRVDVNILNHDGNLIDCACIATLAALSHFHRPDVTSNGEEIIIHPFTEKDPLPLTLFHHPICVSFTTFQNGQTIMDPTYVEEKLGVTQLSIGLNAYRELCCLHFDHTTRSDVSKDIIASVINNASNYAVNLIKKIRDTVKTDVEARYKKVESKAFRFKDSISTGEFTSLRKEHVHIKPSKKNTFYMDVDDDDVVEVKPEVKIELINEVVETKISKLGKKTAELTFKDVDIGTGGKSTWQMSESSSSDDEMIEEVKIVEEKPIKKEKVAVSKDSSDSEEDSVEILSKPDL